MRQFFPLGQDVGNVFAANGLEAQGVLKGTGNFVRPVDFAEGDDLLDVMRSVEAFFLELATIGFGVRAKVQKSQEQGLLTSLLSLGLEFLDMVGMGYALAAVVTAGMDGHGFSL